MPPSDKFGGREDWAPGRQSSIGRSRRLRNFETVPDTSDTESDWETAAKPTRIPDWVPKPFHRLLRYSWRVFLGASLIFLSIILLYLCLSFRYDLGQVSRMPERTLVLDTKGIELGALHGDNRRLIKREEIPPFFIDALRAREDARFLDHHGVDFRGVARATLRNLKDLSFTQGASTLSMQLARNTYDLWDSSLHRKFLETALTWRIEAHYSKDEILTHYLNRIYFGSGCYGIEEAALTYFGIPASKMNENQCAVIAGIIRAPHAFSPLRNLERALDQRDDVLQRMIAEEMITEEEHQRILGLPLGLVKDDTNGSPQAIRSTRRHFNELLIESERQRGGLRIRTTIDAGLQKQFEATLSYVLSPLSEDLQIGALCIDKNTGAIRTVISGKDPKQSGFNRALDSRRDLGETFFPFLAAFAAENQIAIIPDNPVQTGRPMGREEAVTLAERIGLTGTASSHPDDFYRGAIAVSPLQVTTALATLLNDGKRPRSFFIEKISDSTQTVFFENEPSTLAALATESTSASLAHTLNEKPLPTIISGYSPGARDYWILILGKNHAASIWIGHDQPEAIELTEIQREILEKRLQPLVDKL